MRAAVLLAVALVIVALAVVERRAHRRHGPSLLDTLLADLAPVRPVPELPDDVRRQVLAACREADAGEPLPASVADLLARRGAR